MARDELAERWSEPLADEELTPELLPPPHSSFTLIAQFAGTLDGYGVIGYEQLPSWSESLRGHFAGNGKLPRGLDLTHARAALFAEERRHKWTDAYADPDADLAYLHALVEQARSHITGRPAPDARAWSGGPPLRFEFSIGGLMGDSYRVGLDHVAKARHEELELGVLRYEHLRPGHEPYEEAIVRPAIEEWEVFWRRLQQLGVFAWSGEFRDELVLDGTGWRLGLDWDGCVVSTSGANAYPPHGDSPEPSEAFRAFCRAVSRLTGHQIA